MNYLLLHMIFLLAAWAVQEAVTTTQTAAQATAALTANELLPAPHDMAANHRTVNRTMLALLAGTSTELDATTTAALEDIAYQCPLQGGNAVYRARAFLQMFGEYSFHKVDCEEQAALRGGADNSRIQSYLANKHREAMSDSSWALTPNPTGKQFRLTGKNDAISRVGLYNLRGQVLQVWYQVSPQTTLDLPEFLSDGVYFIKLQLQDGSTANLKLVVTR